MLHIDGALNVHGLGAGVVLTNSDGERLKYAFNVKFRASDNEEKYEAFLVGLSLAKKLKAENLGIRYDSLLIVNQVKGEYSAKEVYMIAYLAATWRLVDVLS